ncbi:ectoine/hydroxyectoine ABC transporter substrate-binding protein EhuB [Bradyrhizobium sp. B097]|uniref:ectoine/hydroxyectoine ABC transporter substrate-binding protein EhuB n=1 Tax=Bradyrhizobium sp. B097 TaxID=3140244 RepID=UPI003183108F
MLMASTLSAVAQSITDRVVKEGRITVGIHNQAPWGYVGADGKVAGVGPDMVRAILGPVGVRQVDFVVVDFGALIPSLLSRRIDIVASGMAITDERCRQVIFSNPDLVIGDGVMVLAGNPRNIHSYADVANSPTLRMGGGRGSSNSENAIRAGIPRDRMVLFQDTQSSIAALLAGRIDADTQSMATAISTVRQPGLKGKIELAEPFTGLVENGRRAANYASIAFRPDDARLRDLWNESLDARKSDGTVKEIFASYGFAASMVAPADLTAQKLYPNCR